MAMSNSPSIVNNGLIFHYDMNNPKSYVGPPLTNILPNGINAGYPTSPTGWATYNTNQYGSGAYFSIGTITGISGNIITCPGHPLRTYDVVNPQTTGGGVTGGTNYLVRKWDANSFSLYAYDGTQDSTDIFQTHVNLNSDNRIAVSSGVTNMWWGAPHLPNSGIMKQIVTNGFQYKGRIHDCLRIHWYRADGVTDGMAYGNEPTITSGQTYTISFYHRAATPNCVGYSASINRYTSGEYTGTTFTVGKNWQKCSYTFTTGTSGTTYFYWFNNNMPAQSAFDIAEVMIYQGSGSSEYVTSGSTRSSTQAVLDLTNTNTITASSLTYNSDGTFSFNGSSSYINAGSLNLQRDFTLEAWVKMNDNASFGIFGQGVYAGNQGLHILYTSGSRGMIYGMYGNDNDYQDNYRPSNNVWYHWVFTYNHSTYVKQFYANGVLQTPGSSVQNQYSGSGQFNIGAIYSAATSPANGIISSARMYSSVLSSAEVQQNFNAQRGRYGV